MLTKSEKLVWAAAFVDWYHKSGNVRNSVQAAYEAVKALRLATIPRGEENWEAAKMLNSMREMKP